MLLLMFTSTVYCMCKLCVDIGLLRESLHEKVESKCFVRNASWVSWEVQVLFMHVMKNVDSYIDYDI